MTAQQIVWFTCGYSVELAAVIYFTRAVPRRVFGALAGGAAAGWLLLEIIALGETMGWWQWQFPTASTAGLVILFYVGASISCAPIYLITWRVARRFGGRGLAVCLGFVGLVGPPRDYLIAAHFPAWGGFAPGIAPVVADAAAYVVFVTAGHTVMRIVAGPAKADRLARQSPASNEMK